MKTAGVIAEFDPFHNGHAYFLRRVRELTSADFIIAVISGDYTQRGDPALLDKRLRAEAAMRNGADVVIELPMQYATSSAEFFAYAGVSLLDSLGIVNNICFGTEEEDIGVLDLASEILSYETDVFREKLDADLKAGMNYPEARLRAAVEMMRCSSKPEAVSKADELSEALRRPNNILAVEYLNALKKLGSEIKPVNIRREATDHDDTNTYGIYSSAKNIRETLKVTRSFDSVSTFLPDNTLSVLAEHFLMDFPVYDDDLSLLLKYRLEMETEGSLMQYADMSVDLARRIIKHRHEFTGVSQFKSLIKTRNLTYTRISRALLHTLLNVTKKDMDEYRKAGVTGYARLLGFRKEASAVVAEMNNRSLVPVISRLSDYHKLLAFPFDRMLSDSLRASDIYKSVVRDIFGADMTPEISRMAVSGEEMVLI